jgi:Icc-related predicted phosphoesterase
MIGIIGDIHSHFDDLFKVIEKHPKIGVWLQVGDLGGEETTHYPECSIPFYFISGNHENWDEIEKIDNGQGPKNLHHIKNGETVEIENLKILGFGGNFSPVHSVKADVLTGSRRRHNTSVELFRASMQRDVDILFCHEPPQPYVLKGKECGIKSINELLIKTKPKICFFGHHHYQSTNVIENITCVGLDYGWKSFVSLDPDDIIFEIRYIQ